MMRRGITYSDDELITCFFVFDTHIPPGRRERPPTGETQCVLMRITRPQERHSPKGETQVPQETHRSYNVGVTFTDITWVILKTYVSLALHTKRYETKLK